MKNEPAVTHIDIVGDLTIFSAAEQRQRLLDAISGGSAVEVNLSAVNEIDSAGIQLLIAAKREAAIGERTLRFTGHSAEVIDILELCNLVGHLGDPVLSHPRI